MKRISKDEYYLNIAREVCKRSTCLKRHYGAAIVKNDEIISTGYNGAARGEPNCCNIHKECPRKNVKHNSGNYGDCPAVHAEQNAIISSSRSELLNSILYLYGEDVILDGNGEILVITEIDDVQPCPICMRLIKNSGIKEIVYFSENGKFIKTTNLILPNMPTVSVDKERIRS